jgi:hypothetical protein
MLAGTTKCTHCDCTVFKIVDNLVSGSQVVIGFVQCRDCDRPVGVLNNGNLAFKVEDTLKRVGRVEMAVDKILAILEAKA